MHCADGIAALDPPPSWSEKELWRAGPPQMNTSDGRLDNRERLGEDLNHGALSHTESVSRKRFVSGRSAAVDIEGLDRRSVADVGKRTKRARASLLSQTSTIPDQM